MRPSCCFLGVAIFASIALPAGAQNIAPRSPGANPTDASVSQNPGDVARGRQLFLADGCSECHGTVGEGSVAGPRLAPNPRSPDAIARYIRDPHGVMPPYGAVVLDDRGVQDIQAYLAAVPQPPALASVPELGQ